MKPLKILSLAALALGLFWSVCSGQAAAEVIITGGTSYSTRLPTQSYGGQKTVIVVKDRYGNETVFIEESPIIIKKARRPHRGPGPHRHGHRDFGPHGRPHHGPR
ncbi:MAG: hypothetical protein LBE80_06960 [Deltaproteobacteria bacterium]|nr:hypothetical protein [Deltaproteobacteria bacterium]